MQKAPTAISFGAAASTSAVSCVRDRMPTTCASAMASCRRLPVERTSVLLDVGVAVGAQRLDGAAVDRLEQDDLDERLVERDLRRRGGHSHPSIVARHDGHCQSHDDRSGRLAEACRSPGGPARLGSDSPALRAPRRPAQSGAYDTNANCVLSGDHEGTLIVPCPPNSGNSTRGVAPGIAERHQPQHDVLVRRMPLDARVERHPNQPLGRPATGAGTSRRTARRTVTCCWSVPSGRMRQMRMVPVRTELK